MSESECQEYEVQGAKIMMGDAAMRKRVRFYRTVLILLLLVLILTGCSGDLFGFRDTDNEINLERTYNSVQEYFTFSYPGSWNVIDELTFNEEEVTFLIGLTDFNEQLIRATDGLIFLMVNNFHLLTMEYHLSPDRKNYTEEEFREEIEELEDRYLTEMDFPFASIETTARFNFELGGLPARRLIMSFEDIDGGELLELIETGSIIDFGSEYLIDYLLDDYQAELVVFLHNGQIHSLQYITPIDNYSRNLLTAIYDSFKFE